VCGKKKAKQKRSNKKIIVEEFHFRVLELSSILCCNDDGVDA
jgi:hypothetical protein